MGTSVEKEIRTRFNLIPLLNYSQINKVEQMNDCAFYLGNQKINKVSPKQYYPLPLGFS